jgi:hypothetical protein
MARGTGIDFGTQPKAGPGPACAKHQYSSTPQDHHSAQLRVVRKGRFSAIGAVRKIFRIFIGATKQAAQVLGVPHESSRWRFSP